MLAYRNPSNEDSDSIFNYTLKLDAYNVNAVAYMTEGNHLRVFLIYNRKGANR